MLKILCLWQIPGYSEFLLSFAMLMPWVWFLYRPMNTICSHNSKYGGVICLSLISTWIPYKFVVIPLLGVLIGTKKFACFPLLQYSMFYFSGIYIAKRGMKISRKMLYVSFLLTGMAIAYTLVRHKLPNRFPPSFFWIILPCTPLALYWVCLDKIKELKIISKYKRLIGIYGNNMLDYLVLSNVLIFLTQYLLGKSLDSVGCIMMIIAILLCCIAYTHIKLKIRNFQFGR